MKQIINLLTIVGILFLSVTVKAQLPFKYDSLYKNMYAGEFCKFYTANYNKVTIIDVRSENEFVNTPRLKDAINIPIDTILANYHLLDPHKNKSLIFYCSHSNRSRRVCKLLSEKGYTDIYNLNGGITSFLALSDSDFPCKQDWLIYNSKIKYLNADDAAKLILYDKKLAIVDTRGANEFNSNDTVTGNNLGRIKSAVNFPASEPGKIADYLKNNKDRPVLIYGGEGIDAGKTAKYLTENGFNNVYFLFNGFKDLISSLKEKSILINPPSFNLLNAFRTLKLLKESKEIVIYATEDTMVGYKDMYADKPFGHLKNSTIIDKKEFSSVRLPSKRDVPILIYGTGEAYDFALLLHSKGYKKIFLLNSFNKFLWSAFNVENCKDARIFLAESKGMY